MSGIIFMLVYYSQDTPVSSLELDMIRYKYPSDFKVVCKDLGYRAEKRVYLVDVDTVNRRILVGVKE